MDLSVTRNIYDPVGVGTDHEGQLPVVATARYSPPEYLFRLLDPGPDLWHALDVYQLGGLAHDLIMREPLFESEYVSCSENRYRFAWIVASVSPSIRADDVDEDLVFLARRALDKDWRRRSALKLEDFLADSKVQQDHALAAIGVGGSPAPLQARSDIGGRLRRVMDVARSLEAALGERLRGSGVTAEHYIDPGPNDLSKVLRFRWNAPAPGDEPTIRGVEFRLKLILAAGQAPARFEASAELCAEVDGDRRTATMDLPPVEDALSESALPHNALSALSRLAVEISRPSSR